MSVSFGFDDAVSAVSGNQLDHVFTGLLKLVAIVVQKAVVFGSTFKSLQKTLETLEPTIKRIKENDSKLDRRDRLKGLKDLLDKGHALVKKCEKVGKFNIMRPIYTGKLEKLIAEIKGFIDFDLQLYTAETVNDALVQATLGADLGGRTLSAVEQQRVAVEAISVTVKRQEVVGDMIYEKLSQHGETSGEMHGKVTEIQEMVKEMREWSMSSRSSLSFGSVSRVLSASSSSVGFSLDYDCSPPLLELKPVGFEIPLMEIKAKLIKEGFPRIVVSAPGGCGKTTLATAICHDPQVKDKFDGKIYFLTLSKEVPYLRDIVHKLIYQFDGEVPQFPDDEKFMLDGLKKRLKEKENDPMLLVLDDVWSGSEEFLRNFEFEIKNFHILVTSRYTFPGFGFTYELQPLNEEDAITLLCQSAKLQSNGDSSPAPGRKQMTQIVKSCQGFPLFISVIGGSLRGMEVVDWSVKATQCSDGSVLKNEDALRACLQSSVDALDDEIKNCFMDLGSFQEDQKIPANTLVDVWVELHKLRENIAMAYLFKLSRLNLVQIVVRRKDTSEEDGFYNEHFIKQHDLIRELVVINCASDPIEKRKRLFLDLRGGQVPEWWKEQKQISISANLLSISTDKSFTCSWCDLQAPEVEVLVLNLQSENYVLPEFMGKMAKLKVLIVTNNGLFPAELDKFALLASLSNLKRIRLEKVSIPTSLFTSMQMKKLEKLSLVMCNIVQALTEHFIKLSDAFPNLREVNIDYCNDLVELPPGFCDLVLLNKLSITNCHNLVALPKDIRNLVNLKVLRLNSCIELSELPDTIGDLHDLSVLDISNCFSITTLPEQIGDLRSLRKLCMIDCSGCELPTSVTKLEKLEEVIGDEETVNAWKQYKYFLPKLEVKVHKDISLNWLR